MKEKHWRLDHIRMPALDDRLDAKLASKRRIRGREGIDASGKINRGRDCFVALRASRNDDDPKSVIASQRARPDGEAISIVHQDDREQL